MPIIGSTSRDPYEAKRARLEKFFAEKRKALDELSNRQIAQLVQVDEKMVRKFRNDAGLPPSRHPGGGTPRKRRGKNNG